MRAQEIGASALAFVLGRRAAWRLGRALYLKARADSVNDMRHNGEERLQAQLVDSLAGACEKVVVLDVGANVGDWTWRLLEESRRLGSAEALEVHAFEPAPSAFRALQARMRSHPVGNVVRCVPQVLSSREGTARFHLGGPATGSLWEDAMSGSHEQVEVEETTADRYCARSDIRTIQCLKCDTEGNDMEVLLGAKGLFAEERVMVCQFEYNHRWIYSRHYLNDVFDLFCGTRYRVGKVTPRGVELYASWHPELERFVEGNYVLLHPDALHWLSTATGEFDESNTYRRTSEGGSVMPSPPPTTKARLRARLRRGVTCLMVLTALAPPAGAEHSDVGAPLSSDATLAVGNRPVVVVPLSAASLRPRIRQPPMASAEETGVKVRAEVGALPCQYTGTQVQAALDAAAAAGGGTVSLAPGVYCVDAPVIVRSNIRLVGSGTGATIIRGRAGAYTVGTIVDGAEVYATVAAVAAEAASITNLTVDNATNDTRANGIALLPDGADYSGTPSTRCVVENVRVLGPGDYHTYQIWNLLGTHIKIVNNWIDGGVSDYAPGSAEEGIESYGGTGILISGNTVQNIGNACINLGSAGLSESSTSGVSVENNFLSNCNLGANVGPVYDSVTGPQPTAHVHIRGNVILNAWSAGVMATAREGTVNRDLQVSGNSIKNVGTATHSGYGVFLIGNPDVAGDSSAVVSTAIANNAIENVMGPNGLGIAVIQYPNVRMVGNSLMSCEHSGIYLVGALDADIRDNTIRAPGLFGILVELSSDRAIVKDNLVWEWGRRADTAGIRAANSFGVVVQGNSFFIDNSERVEPAASRIEASVLQGILSDNALLYAPRTTAAFVNASANPNQALFHAIAGSVSVRVDNSLVTPGSRIIVTQLSGSPVAVKVVPGPGYFVATLPSPSLSGSESFRYDILE